MSMDTIITLIIIIVGLYGSAGFCMYKSMTAPPHDEEEE